MTAVDYSQNTNNIENANNFLAENSLNMINKSRVFNQWTDKYSDSCSYKQQLNLSTKPMSYYVNSYNNIAGSNNSEYLSFTPIGNAGVSHIANVYDRPIPSTLQTTSSVYTLPYSTSPYIGASNNVNVQNTDVDLILKTGTSIRSKNNKAFLSEVKYPHFGDIHSDSIGATVQNAGQYYPDDLRNTVDPVNGTAGLNVQPTHFIGGNILAMSTGVNKNLSTRNMYKNYEVGPIRTCPQFIAPNK